MKQSVLIITGHPRSGTSFTASLLQNAGLHIGRKLMAPGHGNVKGFFEDLDIVGFHEDVFRAGNIHPVGWTVEENIRVGDYFKARAQELVLENKLNPVWGWKDPRTTLLLDFWGNLLPEANFLLLYRAPWEVADSIYRRGDEVFLEEPELALKIWINYNRQILRFYHKYPQRCYVASVSSVSTQSSAFVQGINNKFSLQLEEPEADLYVQALLQTQVSESYHPGLVNTYFPEAIKLLHNLNTLEKQNGLLPDENWREKLPGKPDPAGAFNDLLQIRRLEKKVKHLQTELEKIHSQFTQLQTTLSSVSDNAVTL